MSVSYPSRQKREDDEQKPRPCNGEHEVHACVYVCYGGGGRSGCRWTKLDDGEVGLTHLFEQFYFGAQSLNGLVVLAFEIIREACA